MVESQAQSTTLQKIRRNSSNHVIRWINLPTITIVHIAEKPSIGQAIAQGLSGGSSTKSYGKSLPVHEFSTTSQNFPKAPHASSVTHRITLVAGHVYSVDFPSEYQSWDSVDPAELFHAPVVSCVI